ncbi:HEXXH motif domain-containing protein, partial [Streptomyces sp. MB09-02B]|nr:HEXXH motif domain-containing protein [Streptomyces sp. MB09-02B]
MISSALPEKALRELGRTAGEPETLALLVRDQHTRRLLLLRAVLDAVEDADERICPEPLRARLRHDWALLDVADVTAGEVDGRESTPGSQAERAPAGTPVGERRHSAAKRDGTSPARERLLYPLLGPWVRSCLRALRGSGGVRTEEERGRTVRRDLTYLSAVVAAAAVRAGLSFSDRLVARDGVLCLPSLGALRTAASNDATVEVTYDGYRMTLRQPGEIDTVVHLEHGMSGDALSTAAAWTPLNVLPPLLPDCIPVPLDDLDPYREVSEGPHHRDLSHPVSLDEAARTRWLRSWSGVLPVLGLGGERRVEEAAALLRCLVPLAEPGGGRGAG